MLGLRIAATQLGAEGVARLAPFLGDDVDQARPDVAILRAEAACLDLNILHGKEGDRGVRGISALIAQHHAVHHEGRLAGQTAADNQAPLHAGLQTQGGGHRDHREFFDFRDLDVRTARRNVLLHNRTRGNNRHLFACDSFFSKAEIDLGGLVYIDPHVNGGCRLVADKGRKNLVAARRYIDNGEVPVGIGCRPIGRPLNENVHAGQRFASLGILHCAGNLAGGAGICNRSEKDQGSGTQSNEHPHRRS